MKQTEQLNNQCMTRLRNGECGNGAFLPTRQGKGESD